MFLFIDSLIEKRPEQKVASSKPGDSGQKEGIV